ncbi:MAG: hypothetical protein AAF403_03235 [Pseudomonadota bacterium]
MLVSEGFPDPSVAGGLLFDGGEIDVGGQVLEADEAEGIGGFLLPVVALEVAGRSPGAEVVFFGKTVVEEKEVPAGDEPGDPVDPGEGLEVEFGPVTFRERGRIGEVRQEFGSEFGFDPGEATGGIRMEPDPAFAPARGGSDAAMHRKGIEQFVGEDEGGTVESGERFPIGVAVVGRGGFLRAGRRGVDEVVVDGAGGRGIKLFQFAEDVAGQLAAGTAAFDEGEVLRLARPGPLGEDVIGEELTEAGADRDAGIKIARFARFAPAGGVVAITGCVERHLHERGKRERAFPADPVFDPGLEPEMMGGRFVSGHGRWCGSGPDAADDGAMGSVL